MKVRKAFNIHNVATDPIQFGGVLTSTSGKAVAWILEEGSNPRGLGRWLWQ